MMHIPTHMVYYFNNSLPKYWSLIIHVYFRGCICSVNNYQSILHWVHLFGELPMYFLQDTHLCSLYLLNVDKARLITVSQVASFLALVIAVCPYLSLDNITLRFVGTTGSISLLIDYRHILHWVHCIFCWSLITISPWGRFVLSLPIGTQQ